MFEKRRNWSVSIKFNSQFRVWVRLLAQGLWGSSRYIVPGPDTYGGAWNRRTGPLPDWDTRRL